MGNDDAREEVPMTAEAIEDVWVRMPRGRREWTWADLQEIPDDDGHRYEIIDGSLYVSASPTPRHQLASSRLTTLLAGAAPGDLEVVPAVGIDLGSDDLEVVPAVGIDLGSSVLEPDVLVVSAAAVLAGRPKFAAAEVLLAVEVVSPSSRRMDRMIKPSVLADAGVPAYWRVELEGADAPVVVMHVLSDGVYREVLTVRAGEAVVLDSPFPVEVRPAELVGPRWRD
jgi:Uma2 family endonuclease